MTLRWSIIISSRNEGDWLRSTLEHVRNASEDHEVIVVDDGSSDDSCAPTRLQPMGAQVLRTEHVGIAKARNIGAGMACGEFLIFIDAHTKPVQGWLEIMTDLMAMDERLAVVGPAIHVLDNWAAYGTGMRITGWHPPMVYPWELHASPEYVCLVPGGAQMWRRSAFFQLQGFASQFVHYGAEDMEACVRAWLQGWRVAVTPLAQIGCHFKTTLPTGVGSIEPIANQLRLDVLNYTAPMLLEAYRRVGQMPNQAEIMATAASNGIMRQREFWLSRQRHSIEWLMSRFPVSDADGGGTPETSNGHSGETIPEAEHEVKVVSA